MSKETPVAEPVAQDLETKIENELADKVVTDQSADQVPDEKDKKLYKQILDEKKKLQQKYEKILEEKEAAEKKKLEEQGKFKELYDQAVKENEDLKNFRKAIEENLKSEVESELEGQSDTIKELINEIPDYAKKLSYLKKLKSQKPSGTGTSPVSERAGGEAQIHNINLADYRGPEGRAKLMQLQKSDPKLFDRVLELKNK